MALSKSAHVCQWMFPESLPLFLTHLHQVCPFPHLVFFVLSLSHCFGFIAVCLLLSCLLLPLFIPQINSMKFLQQLNRQSARTRRRGRGDRVPNETGGGVSMAMRCVAVTHIFVETVSAFLKLNRVRLCHARHLCPPSGQLRGPSRGGGDVFRLGHQLRPWPVRLWSRPTARYAAAEVHR